MPVRLSCVNVKDLQHCLVCACASEGKFRSSSVEAENIFEVFSLAVKSHLYIFVSFFSGLDVYPRVKSAKTCLCMDMSVVFVLLSQIMLRFMRALSVTVNMSAAYLYKSKLNMNIHRLCHPLHPQAFY